MKKILLIIDMQNGFITDEKYINIKNKINNYILNSHYDKYIFTKFLNTKNSIFIKKLNWHELKDKKSQEICVNIPKDSLIINKTTCGLNKKDILKIKKLLDKNDEIDICGVQAEACVYMIAMQLFDFGIFPNILLNYTCGEINDIEKLFINQFSKIEK